MIRLAAVAAIWLCAGGIAAAEDARVLDADSQALKRQILELDRDLRVLEDLTLHPADSRIAIFVAMDIGAFFKLESVKVELDNREIARHDYTDAETDALIRGAAHEVYVGNLSSGPHQLLAVFTGKGPHGRDYRRAVNLDLQPASGPRNVELRVGDWQDPQKPQFSAQVKP
ncbi:AraC family transcriptional regulator [Hydrocarboniphaga sp.]|uniref:AraC family transcriptional regulator n=1 Tax=Hydrocarboniphaga sp. TaxID=2033016 RepID=UPI003D132AC4